jgi:hypothetical protein
MTIRDVAPFPMGIRAPTSKQFPRYSRKFRQCAAEGGLGGRSRALTDPRCADTPISIPSPAAIFREPRKRVVASN